MAWIMRDYECPCGYKYEDIVNPEAQATYCPECLEVNEPVLSPTKAATYSLMSKDDQAKHLRKRSRDHTRKELKKDPTQARMTKKLKMKGTG